MAHERPCYSVAVRVVFATGRIQAVLQLASGFAMIAGLLAIQAAVLYAIWWLVMLVVGFVPIVGKKHKHRDWERLNAAADASPPAALQPAIRSPDERITQKV